MKFKQYRWQIILGTALVLLSALIYYLHYLAFHDSHHIFIYLVGDIAFVPIEVLLVTLILHNILAHRDKKSKMQKLNMVIGTFFSELGNKLIETFSDHDPTIENIREKLIPTADWTDEDFDKLLDAVDRHDFSTNIKGVELDELRTFVLSKRDFILNLLANPNLLEHDRFTDLLWAVFHMAEEFTYRKAVTELKGSDLNHIKGDMNRAYTRIVGEWVEYNKHLKKHYPFLFSLSMRTNPFNPEAKIEIT